MEGKLLAWTSTWMRLLSAQHLLTNDHHLKRGRLRIPAGQISFVMDRNLLQPSHLIGLWLGAALSWWDSRSFWRWLIASASGPSDAARRTGTVSLCFPLTHHFIWIRRIGWTSLESKWSLRGYGGILTLISIITSVAVKRLWASVWRHNHPLLRGTKSPFILQVSNCKPLIWKWTLSAL